MSNEQKPVEELFDDYLHGLLDKLDAERVERHLEENPEAEEHMLKAKARKESLESAPMVEASEGLIHKTLERVSQRENRRTTFRRVYFRSVAAITVACVVLFAGLQFHYQQLTASPYDLRMVGQSDLLAGTGASLRVAVYDQTSGELVPNVPMEIKLINRKTDETRELLSFQLDENGQAQPCFQLPDWKSGEYDLQLVAYTDAGPEVLSESVSLTRSWKLMVSTDKPVYKPGQTIHIRTLGLRRPDLKPVADEEATITITDPKGNVIFRRRNLTSGYGITSADCPLATEIIEGPYTITAILGDTETSMTVEVMQYTLPKFKIGLTLDRPFYQPNDVAKGTIQVDYFFGQPVASAEVELTLNTIDVGLNTMPLDSVTTDENGKAEFEVEIPDYTVGRPQHGGDAHVQLVANVTDSAGQKENTSVSRIITTNPIDIELIPESGRLVTGEENRIFVLTSYADGRPAETLVKIPGQEEFSTSQLGVATFSFTPKKNEESVRFTVRATEVGGDRLVGRETATLQVGQIANDFIIRSDQAVYKTGDTITLMTIGGGVEPVLVDFLKDGQTILTQMIEVTNGRGELQFELPAELFGTVQMCAYRFNQNAIPVMKLRTIFVQRSEELQISAALDRESYRPGESAKLNLTITDAKGKPVPGAISLSAVDEAVYHVLKQRPGLEQAFFALEQELLEPVYAIYGGWAPELHGIPEDVPVADRNEFQQALFAFTSQIVAEHHLPRFDENVRRDGGDDRDFEENVFVEPMVEEMGFVPAMIEENIAVEIPAREVEEIARDNANADSPITMFEASYGAKLVRVADQKKRGLQWVAYAWWYLAGGVVIALLFAFAVLKPKWFLISGGIVGGLALCTALLLPAIQSAWKSGDATVMNVMEGEGAAGGAGAFENMDFGDDMMAVPQMAMEEMALMEAPTEMDNGKEGEGSSGSDKPVRVRRHFPETLLWKPQIITDDNGIATLNIDLADSITTWRVMASAVSADGQMGALQEGIRVFQPFFVDLNLPVALTRNDEVAVPVVVYNYLNEPQTVELELAKADWFEFVDPSVQDEPFQRIDLAPGEVRSTSYRLKALEVGNHSFQITARAADIADAMMKEIMVVPDGDLIEVVENGSLSNPVDFMLEIPAEAIPGSVKATVRFYPSSFSQLVEGLDAIFQRPYGCFEQTSSTTYPNILALQYLRDTNRSMPEVEAKARQYIHLGYQRLLGFEVDGGGFDWFGSPPANVTLTAYGLLEFEDMAEVHDVDPNLINRTRDWLLSKRNRQDGSWKAEIGMLNDGLAGSVQKGKDLDLSTTAYIAWAVFRGGKAKRQSEATLDFLLAHDPKEIDNPYTLAMVANALAAIDPDGKSAERYVNQLVKLAKRDAEKKQTSWSLGENRETAFYGAGRSGDIEVTALATLALLETQSHVNAANEALNWLITQRDSRGTWHSTQATILALQAIIRGTSSGQGDGKAREIDIALDGRNIEALTIEPDQSEVVQQIDITPHLVEAMHHLQVTERSNSATGYQITLKYHIPNIDADPELEEPLTIELAYDRSELQVNDRVNVTATVTNNMPLGAPMVIVDLPIPAGFTIQRDGLEKLRDEGSIEKFQINARTTVIYLRGLASGQKLELKYGLKATMPVKITAPPATVYEYYDPDVKNQSEPIQLIVGGKA